jgi:hypothetical protein
MRVMLDTNLYSSIGDENAAKAFADMAKIRSIQIGTPPSTLVEVINLPAAEPRQIITNALARGPRIRLQTEAQSECWELVSAIRRCRPNWVRRVPDTARVASLSNFWTNKIWRQVLGNSEGFHAYQSREKPLYDYLVDQQRAQQREKLETKFNIRPLPAIVARPVLSDPADINASGWSGEPVEAWRVINCGLYWHQLKVVAGRAVLTRENTTFADWVEPYVEVSPLRSNFADFTRLWHTT